MATAKITRDRPRHPYVITWVVAAGLCAVVLLSNLEGENKSTFLVIIASSALLLSVAMKTSAWEWSVVDGVYDGGDSLVVKYHAEEETKPCSFQTSQALSGYTEVPGLI